MTLKRLSYLTIFPPIIEHYLSASLLGKAIEKGILESTVVDLRDFAENKSGSIDDRVYGGGPGMVFRPEPLAKAIRSLKEKDPSILVIYPSPSGRVFSQEEAKRLVRDHESLFFICGRYEGIDERIIEKEVDLELSLGDFILAGGELPALAISEACARLIPGVIGHADVHKEESFSDGLLEYPHYTRPELFEGMAVPDVLLSGHHEEIRKWRAEMSLKRTSNRRPDLVRNEKK